VLTEAQQRSFFDDGYLYVRGAVDRAQAAAMEERTWRRLERNGIRQHDRSTWNPGASNHLQSVRRGDRDLSSSPVIRAALDGIFGVGAWLPPRDWGQVLVTFPTDVEWRLPWRPWHLDHPYVFDAAPVSGVNIFLFDADVEPRGGGTLVVQSSPALVRRFLASIDLGRTRTTKQMRTQLGASHPWLRELTTDDGGERAARFMDEPADIDGIPARVVELTGAAGDAVICHPHAIHNSSLNVRDRPRIMRAARVFSVAFLEAISPERTRAGS
jgi:hypothetical protein